MTAAPCFLHVVTDTDRRGAQRFGVDLHTWLSDRGHLSRVVALAPGVTSQTMALPVLGHKRLAPATLRRLRTALSEATVAIAHGSSTLAASAVAGAGLRTPFVYRSIGDLHYWADTPRRRVQLRVLLSRAAAVVALWSAARDVLVADFGVPSERVHVIPRGVPAAAFPAVDAGSRAVARRQLALPDAGPVLLSLGSLSAEKDVAAAIGCLASLDDAFLIVAGDGPLRGRLEQMAGQVAPGRVRFLGAVERPADVIAAADVLMLPSLTEGLPGVAVEAGLSGVPTVATDVGGVRDVVIDGVTGRVVPPRQPAAFAEAVRAALGERDRLGRSARDHCLRGFELDAVGLSWERLLGRLAAPRRI